MTKSFKQLQEELRSIYALPLSIERIIPHTLIRMGGRIVFLFWVFLLFPAFGIIGQFQSGAIIGLFIFTLILIELIAIDAVVYSHVFREGAKPYEYESARIIVYTNTNDPLKTFLKASIGKKTLLRAGILPEDFSNFLASRKGVTSREDFTVDGGTDLVETWIESMVDAYPEFEGFLSAHSVSATDVWNSFRIEAEKAHKKLSDERWWSKEYLSTIHPIGREWAYGSAYFVARYCDNIRFDPRSHSAFHEEETKHLNEILSKSRGANAMIVGDQGSGKMEVIENLAREYLRHDASVRFLVFKTEVFLTSVEDQVQFERAISKILEEIHRAGNIIFIIPDLPALIRRSNDYNLDLATMFAPFLRSQGIQIVAISDTEDFHTLIESLAAFTQQFEHVQVKDADKKAILSYVLDQYSIIEQKEGVMISYPALLHSITVAEQYLVTTPLYHGTMDVLYEAISHARNEGRKFVTKEDVLAIVQLKTGVPAGEVSEKEKRVLENLESYLSERIIGQKEAISAISDSLRRARAGLNNPNRPLGSFMFLGPTGVGKTETAKALSEIFFGEKKNMMRLDMSEYQTPDALSRLLGSYGDEGAGVLSNLIRENPYGVLLLDEFEKTHKTVHDLFLQIIDEGIFRDGVGRKVSARNLILIATTNAGSSLILDTVKLGKNLEGERENIISSIIQEGVFKPELLNRFDGVILFHALSPDDLKNVATLLLGGLQWRLKEKHITLEVTDDLIQYLVKEGSDPEFGARPLARAIQNSVESVIAKKILSGEYKAGSSVKLTSADFE